MQLAVAAVMFVGSAYKGAQKKKLKEKEAQAYIEARDRRMAAATREAAEARREKEFMYSRALASSGKQSGKTSEPGIATLLADLNAEGEYHVMSRIWAGQNEAEGLAFRAEAARREGEAAYMSGLINGVTSAVSSYYGMGGSQGLTTQDQMSRGLDAAKAERLEMGQVWSSKAKAWVPKIPSARVDFQGRPITY